VWLKFRQEECLVADVLFAVKTSCNKNCRPEAFGIFERSTRQKAIPSWAQEQPDQNDTVYQFRAYPNPNPAYRWSRAHLGCGPFRDFCMNTGLQPAANALRSVLNRALDGKILSHSAQTTSLLLMPGAGKSATPEAGQWQRPRPVLLVHTAAS